MDNTNFWLRNQPIAYAVVNGLMGSISLWAFWTPFITFLAEPIASAVMKQDICSAVNNLPSNSLLPGYSKNAGNILLNQDAQTLQSTNTGTIISLWLLAGLSITISLWIVTSLIQKGQLDINHIIQLNLALFVAIITIELTFFIGIGLRFIPFNLRDLYDNIVNLIVQDLSQYQ